MKFKFKLIDGTYTLIKCKRAKGDVVIPAEHRGKPVTGIGSFAFYNCPGLTSVTIPNSVTSIGSYAFDECTGLTGVYITDIAAWCRISFDNPSANPLYYAKKLYLNGTLVTDLVIPSGVTGIGSYAFYECPCLTSVTIPDSVTSIGSDAFEGCTGLASVTIGNGVTSIGSDAFSRCYHLTSVTIPDSVTSIGDSAFRGCTRLTSVTIPDSVTSIGYNAFCGCTGLTSVTIPDSVTGIGKYAFYNCTGLTEINFNATAMNDLSSDNYVFYSAGKSGSGITVNVGANVTRIPAYLFYSYSSGSSTYTVKLAHVKFAQNSNCTSIGNRAFYDCTSLTSVTIPGSVTSIGSYAFSGCTGLTSVTIPDSVTSIGYDAFNTCTGLKSVIFEDVEGWKAKDTQIKAVDLAEPDVAARCLTQAYRDKEWSHTATTQTDFNLDFTLLNGTYTLTKYTGNCKTLHIPSAYRGVTVTAIADSAFKGCTDIRLIHIPSNITAIGNSAFEGCTGLVSVKMADGVTAIGELAFGNCQKLSSITLSEGLTSIPAGLFRGCTALTAIRIPRSVTSIGKSAFASCGLTDIRIPSSVTAIGETAFGFCSKLARLRQ